MLTQNRLLELLSYDTGSGVFKWRASKFKALKDAPAGCIASNGYRVIRIDGKNYRAARLAWLYVHGVTPALIVDHQNRIRTDDRLSNLRLATPKQNSSNRSPQRNNTSGFTGVCESNPPSGRWAARIRDNGKLIYLGCFATKEEAAAAYASASMKFMGDFSAVIH